MSSSALLESINRHLSRIGTDVETFLRSGFERGQSVERLASELERITDISVSYRTLYRWSDALGIQRPDLRERAS